MSRTRSCLLVRVLEVVPGAVEEVRAPNHQSVDAAALAGDATANAQV